MKTTVQKIRKMARSTMQYAMVLVLMSLVTQRTYAQCSLDIHIANDQSGSIDGVENSQGKTFVRKLAQSIELGTGPTGNRIAVSNWANTNTWSQYNFPSAGANYTTNVADLISYANSRQTIFGGTDPYQALQRAYQNINITPISGRTSPKVIVLMTDAYCSQIQPGIATLASQIKASGIYIMVLALDDATTCASLQGTNVASPGMYLSGGSYSNLQTNAITVLQELIAKLCSSTTKAWDLKIALNAADCSTGATTYTVSNVGTAPFSDVVNVSFYNGDPTLPTTKLLTSTTHAGQSIAPGSSTSLSFTSASLAGVARIYAVVNIAPASATPPLAYNLSNVLAVPGEGGATNNMSGVFSATGCPVVGPVLQVSKVFAGIDCNKHAVYNVQVCNTSAVDATGIEIKDYPELAGATLLSSTVSVGGAPGPVVTRTYTVPAGSDPAQNQQDPTDSGYDGVGYNTNSSNSLYDFAYMEGKAYITSFYRIGWDIPIGGANAIPQNAIITSAKFNYATIPRSATVTGTMAVNYKVGYFPTDVPFQQSAGRAIWNLYDQIPAYVSGIVSSATNTPSVDVTSLVQTVVNNVGGVVNGNFTVFAQGQSAPDLNTNWYDVPHREYPQNVPNKLASLTISYIPAFTLPAGQCMSASFTYDMSTGTTGTAYQNSAGVTTTSAGASILPNSNFAVGSATGINGYNGAVNTGDEFTMPADCTPQPAAPITTAVTIDPASVCGGGGNYVTATVTITNPNTVSMYNALENFNLTGAGATFAGEPYEVTNGLSLAQANVLDPNYPAVPNALYSKTGSQGLTIYQIPPGTSTFKIDLSAGTAAFNLASTVSNLPALYNSTGSSNTAQDAEGVAISAGPALSITSPADNSSIPSTSTTITLAGTATNSATTTWTSGTWGPETAANPASPTATYTISDQDRANGYVNITLRGVSSQGCDNATAVRVNLTGSTYDFGDALTTYDYSQATTPGVGGALITSSNIFLGALAPDAESSPFWSAPANGDDNNNTDDEDGVTTFPDITTGATSYSVGFTATNTSGANATAIAWIDWNNDGFFEPSEGSLPVVILNGSNNVNVTANWSGITVTAATKRYARLRIATNLTIYDYVGTTNNGEVEDYVIAQKPTAENDVNPGNTPGVNAVTNILTNDKLADGSPATPATTSVALTTTGLPTGSTVSGDGLTVTVPGEGVWTYNPTTGDLIFDPQPGFSGNPTDITYILTETATGLTDPATVDVTYVQTPPVANDDSSTGNILGSSVTVDILANDKLADGSTGTPTNTSVALTTTGLPAGSTVSPDGLTVTVPGQGGWTYNPSTGNLTFVPNAGYNSNPTPVTYVLTETATGLTDNATVTVTYSGALPVKLTKFSAVKEGNSVLISWSTTEETNSESFAVQHGTDGKEWNVIGIVSAKGESKDVANYHYTHTTPVNGENLYRLKMIDLDGTYTYSRIQSLQLNEAKQQSMVYPNPSSGVIKIGDMDLSKISLVEILDINGKVVYKSTTVSSDGIDVSFLKSGIYILKSTQANGQQNTHKVVISR